MVAGIQNLRLKMSVMQVMQHMEFMDLFLFRVEPVQIIMHTIQVTQDHIF